MKSSSQVARAEVTGALTGALEGKAWARAFWEGGAAAFGRVDEWSDLDLYVLVRPGRVREAFRVVEGALGRLSPIAQLYEVGEGYEGVAQRFYRLRDASEYAFIDLAVLTRDAPEKFLDPEIHGRNVFYIDRDGLAGKSAFDPQVFRRSAAARWKRLGERFAMFDNQVQKEINRGNAIEALDNYRAITLGTLIELLRLRHSPLHHSFKTRYVHYELPRPVVERLVRLSFVAGPEELPDKHAQAAEWVRELLREGMAAPAAEKGNRRRRGPASP